MGKERNTPWLKYVSVCQTADAELRRVSGSDAHHLLSRRTPTHRTRQSEPTHHIDHSFEFVSPYSTSPQRVRPSEQYEDREQIVAGQPGRAARQHSWHPVGETSVLLRPMLLRPVES